MIISHKHKFIFIKTEKTAGTSIEIALSKICGPKDIITPISKEDELYRKELGYVSAQNYKLAFNKYSKYDLIRLLFNGKKAQFYNHISGRAIQKYISKNTWDSYYKFCFERNPFDKLISWYYWNDGNHKYPTILDFIKTGDAGKIKGFELYTNNGIPIVDDIFKYENIKEALSTISMKLDLDEEIKLPSKKTKSRTRKDRRNYREVLSDEEKEWVSKIFARELAYLNYQY